MNKSYLIQWKSKVNGRSGRGTKLFEKQQAEQLAEDLNREYPQIEHSLLEVHPGIPAQQAQTLQPPEESESPLAPSPATLLTA